MDGAWKAGGVGRVFASEECRWRKNLLYDCCSCEDRLAVVLPCRYVLTVAVGLLVVYNVAALQICIGR
jgi:hypothetical protein